MLGAARNAGWERELKVAQGLGKAGEGLPALQVILTPHPPAIGTEIQFGGFTGPDLRVSFAGGNGLHS